MASNGFISHPNQKNITVHRQSVDKDFLCIKNENWKRANRELTPYGLQLYLYLASNKDGYHFDLSAEHADRDANIKRTSFHTYINLMIKKGYLVKGKGNCFDFYETPQQVQPVQEDEQEESAFDDSAFDFSFLLFSSSLFENTVYSLVCFCPHRVSKTCSLTEWVQATHKGQPPCVFCFSRNIPPSLCIACRAAVLSIWGIPQLYTQNHLHFVKQKSDI